MLMPPKQNRLPFAGATVMPTLPIIMAKDSADVNIASLQQELVALKGDLKITKQNRESGLQRLHDLRIENKRLKLQLGKVIAQEELALKIESLRQQVEVSR